jgi:tetratricopeptide (TPR) repeat protein
MNQPRSRQASIVLALVVCVVYLTYRAFFTFNLTTPYAIAASATLYAAELFMGVLMLLFLLQVLRPEEPPEEPVLAGRTVDVFVPTYNEDVEILRTTLTRLLEGGDRQPELWADFLAAAAAAPSLDARARKLVRDLYDRTVADPPRDPLFLSRLAQALRSLKEPDKAVVLLRRAVRIDPDSRPLKLLLAETLYDAGVYADAERYFLDVLRTGSARSP